MRTYGGGKAWADWLGWRCSPTGPGVDLCRGDAEVIDRVSGGRARLRVVS